MPEGLRDLLVGDWWRYTISVLGALILAVGVGSVLLDGQLTTEEAQQVAGLVVLSVLLIALGARVAIDVRDGSQLFRILGWMSLGVLVLGVLGVWYHTVTRTAETAFGMALLFLSVLAAGALFGTLAGYYDVRVRVLVERASRETARRESLDEQQETLSALNGILRHQILNDLSAISGRAELLAAERIDSETATDSILSHCDHMEETVERIETVVDVLTWVTETTEIDVPAAIDRAIATVREDHPDLTVETEGVREVTVLADDLLYLALAEILDNAAVHPGPDSTVSVSVRETVETVVIDVTDDGPGVAVSPTESLFEPNTHGPESNGDGLGLFLADLIVDRYDGTIRLDETKGGTTVTVELPAHGTVTGAKVGGDAD